MELKPFELNGSLKESGKVSFMSERGNYPDIPWKEMAGVRDKLIHHYFGINFEVVWTIIHEELPGVENGIGVILNNISFP